MSRVVMNAPITLRTTVVTLALAVLPLVALGCSAKGEETAAAQAAQLYAQNCQACHGDAATGAGRSTALIPSHGPDGHTWHHADAQIIDIVLGRFTYPGREMPSFGESLTEEQVELILAHIKLGWNDEMREYQAEVSRSLDELSR